MINRSTVQTRVVLVTVAAFASSFVSIHARSATDTSPHPRDTRTSCSSSKEFVTALEFLRNQKSFELKEDQARKTAEAVAQGCQKKTADPENAAKRFIRVTELLSKAGLTSNNAIDIALEFSAKKDQDAETFITVFKYAFLQDYLDLDMLSAVELAKKLSLDFVGNTQQSVSDFEKLVKYCASEKFLDLPKPRCGDLAARLAKWGERESKGIAKSWITTFEFLRTPEKGPGLATGQALQLSEEILRTGGMMGLENFVQGYRYAVHKKGLDMSAEDALHFAKKMAAMTKPEGE